MSIAEYRNGKIPAFYDDIKANFAVLAEGEIPYQTKMDLSLDESAKAKFRIHCGDAFDFIKTLPQNSIDLVITSPPYWGQRSYTLEHNWDILAEWKGTRAQDSVVPSYEWYRANGGVLGLEPLPEWYISHLCEIIDQIKGCLKPGGNLWVNIGDTYFARWSSIREKGRQGLGSQERMRRKTPMGGYRQEKQLLLIPARFAIAMQDRRWILRNDLIWYKPNVPPRPETDRLRLAHEHFYHFVKRPTQGRPKYYYDKSYVEPEDVDVVQYNVTAGRNGHTATFPIKLITPRILSSSPVNGVIFDPFCGTGRSLAVAVKHGRHAIGCDVVRDFALTARDFIFSFAADSASEE
jgi:site-specific DNA-methyltransferase (cytosine-N4-specific)